MSKTCPFCGSAKTINKGVNIEHDHYEWIVCVNCGASGPVTNTKEAAVAAWENRVDPWITVTERLPEGGQKVLMLVNGRIEEATHLDFLGVWTGSGIVYRDETGFVTHWRPLPEPPAGEMHS